MNYEDFQFIRFERHPHGVLVATLNRPEAMNATNDRLHWELTQLWGVINADQATKVIVVTGAGDRAFSAGGDLGVVEAMVGNPAKVAQVMQEASDIVYNMLACDKPVITRHQRHRRRRRSCGGPARGCEHHRRGCAAHRRARPPGCRGRRPRGHRMAAAVQHGQGQVLPDDGRLHRRPGGRAHRAGQPVHSARRVDGPGMAVATSLAQGAKRRFAPPRRR